MRYLIGHRGASGYEPENTVRSFRRALDDGANSLEMDLRLTRDGEIVVIHDRTVDRTTDGRGEVSGMDLSELRELDAGEGEQIPLLSEVISLSLGQDAAMFLEVKVPGLGRKLTSMLVEHDAIGNSVVFGRDHVGEVHDLEPGISCTYPGSFRIGIHDLSPGTIADMHRRGLVLIHGDIDEKGEMRRLIGLGLDGIITNYPNRLADVVRDRRR